MVFFLAFLTLTAVVVPMVNLSHLGQLVLSLTFALTLTFGAFATIQHHTCRYLVVGLTASTFTVDVITELGRTRSLATIDTALKLTCLSILVFMTLKRTLRPGRITGYRVTGGIAGYLLIGLLWSFGYQLLVQCVPDALHFEADSVNVRSEQPNPLIYFSFVTLTTVGYGDVKPVHPIARSLCVAEALVGQLYLAILIGSLVGMALQARSAEESSGNPN
jgi:hypothetical protein